MLSLTASSLRGAIDASSSKSPWVCGVNFNGTTCSESPAKVIVFVASTGWFADSRTAAVFRALLSWIAPGTDAERVEVVNTAARKLGHFVEYAILGWLIARALHDTRGHRDSHAVLAVALATAYAITDELHQRFVLGRSAAASDVVIDMLGAVAAQLASALWWRSRRRA